MDFFHFQWWRVEFLSNLNKICIQQLTCACYRNVFLRYSIATIVNVSYMHQCLVRWLASQQARQVFRDVKAVHVRSKLDWSNELISKWSPTTLDNKVGVMSWTCLPAKMSWNETKLIFKAQWHCVRISACCFFWCSHISHTPYCERRIIFKKCNIYYPQQAPLNWLSAVGRPTVNQQVTSTVSQCECTALMVCVFLFHSQKRT